jgi:hypothetical protein
MYYKFSSTAIENPEGLSAYELYKRVEAGEELKGEQPLFNELCHYEAYRNGVIKQMGWLFDFRPFFRLYLVKFKYEGWQEIYAPNKTFIRVNSSRSSYILKIIEIPK